MLVHYLCSTSSRAQPNPARAGSQNLDDGGAGRPRRESARQAAQRGGRRGLSQARLSPLATQSSLEGSLVSQSSGDASAQGLDPLAALPLVQGISLEQAAALPSLAQQYAMQQQMLAAVQVAAVAPAVAPPAPGVAHTGGPALTPLPPLAPGLLGPSGGSGNLAALAADIDPFGFPVAELQRPHAGVLYTGQRMASQLAAQQQPGLVAAGAAGGGGIPVSPLGRPLFKQESFSSEQHRALFREMSLGIQVGCWAVGWEGAAAAVSATGACLVCAVTCAVALHPF